MTANLVIDFLAGGLIGVAIVAAILVGVVIVLVRLTAGYPSRGRHAPGRAGGVRPAELVVERTERGEPVGP